MVKYHKLKTLGKANEESNQSLITTQFPFHFFKPYCIILGVHAQTILSDHIHKSFMRVYVSYYALNTDILAVKKVVVLINEQN